MKYIIFGFALLLLAIWLGLEMARNTGYIFITYHQWSIETTLWTGMVSLVIVFILFYLLIRSLVHIIAFPNAITSWKKIKKEKKARLLMNMGLCLWCEGQWAKAENTFLKAIKYTKNTLVLYLFAAKAAQAQKSYIRRDQYLRCADQFNRQAALSIGLTQAQLQIESNQWEQALAGLKHLLTLYPRNHYVLKLLFCVYEKLEDWEELQNILPDLKQCSILTKEELEDVEKSMYVFFLKKSALQGSEALHQRFKNLPKKWQNNPVLIENFVNLLIEKKEFKHAGFFIEQTLRKQWDAHLVNIYGIISQDQPLQRLLTAENWEKQYPNEPELFICLARLSIKSEFFGKAKEYLQSALKFPSYQALAYKILGEVQESMGDEKSALECYRKGMKLSTVSEHAPI